MGANRGGQPVEGAGEEVGGEGYAEVAPCDAGEGGDGRVAGVCGREGGAQGDEDVEEEEAVEECVSCADLGVGAGGAEREAVRERPELVTEREEHEGLPAARGWGLGIKRRDGPTGAARLGQIEVHLSQAPGLGSLFQPIHFVLGQNQDRSAAAATWHYSIAGPAFLMGFQARMSRRGISLLQVPRSGNPWAELVYSSKHIIDIEIQSLFRGFLAEDRR